jgi:hypothetical protein
LLRGESVESLLTDRLGRTNPDLIVPDFQPPRLPD